MPEAPTVLCRRGLEPREAGADAAEPPESLTGVGFRHQDARGQVYMVVCLRRHEGRHVVHIGGADTEVP